MSPDFYVFSNIIQIVVASTACFVGIGLVGRILRRVGLQHQAEERADAEPGPR